MGTSMRIINWSIAQVDSDSSDIMPIVIIAALVIGLLVMAGMVYWQRRQLNQVRDSRQNSTIPDRNELDADDLPLTISPDATPIASKRQPPASLGTVYAQVEILSGLEVDDPCGLSE